MKNFHITIKDNETGETVHDLDTDAIVGAISEDDSTWEILMTSCDANTLISTIDAAEKAIKHALKNRPELLILKLMAQCKGRKAADTEEATENTEN